MKNYSPFFELTKFQVVYVPMQEEWKYSKLHLDLNKRYLRFLNSKNLFGAWIAGFIFLKQALFIVIWIWALFLVLSMSKKWAKRLHLLIPIIVYSEMWKIEVTNFLKEHPQFAKTDIITKTPNSRIVAENVDDISDDIMSKIWKEPISSKNENNFDTIILEEDIKKTEVTTTTKSIFDDYESVMDKFNKK